MSQSELSFGQWTRSRAVRPSARGVCFWYQSVSVARATASCRYRMGHFAELTRGADIVIAERLPASVVRQADTVVCLRPHITPTFERDLGELRRAGVRLVADFDDLLFAGLVSGLPASATGTGTESDKAQRLARYAAALRIFDRLIVSTRALRERARSLVPAASTTLVPNALSEAWVAQGKSVYAAHVQQAQVIRYFSGSPSHDADIASVLPPLRRFLEAHPQVQLEIVGHARVDLSSFPQGRARQLPSVSYDELPRLLRTTWVNLAPLVPSEFTACKSAIKFLEAAAFECPTLASTNDDILRHRESGAPIVTCDSDEEWFAGLCGMLDPAARREAGRRASQYVTDHGMARNQLPAWLAAVGVRDR